MPWLFGFRGPRSRAASLLRHHGAGAPTQAETGGREHEGKRFGSAPQGLARPQPEGDGRAAVGRWQDNNRIFAQFIRSHFVGRGSRKAGPARRTFGGHAGRFSPRPACAGLMRPARHGRDAVDGYRKINGGLPDATEKASRASPPSTAPSAEAKTGTEFAGSGIDRAGGAVAAERGRETARSAPSDQRHQTAPHEVKSLFVRDPGCSPMGAARRRVL